MGETAPTKDEVRAAIFARRAEMPLELQWEKSAEICSQLTDYLQEYANSCSGLTEEKPFCVGAYYEIKNEVKVRDFREYCWEHGWRLALPCVVEPGYMEFYSIARPLVEGKVLPFLQHPGRCYTDEDVAAFLAENNIDPADCVKVAPEEMDAAVVPLVGFNASGARLGYGGGNYDRYVPRMREGVLLVGVAFEEQRENSLKAEPWDCVMEKIFFA